MKKIFSCFLAFCLFASLRTVYTVYAEDCCHLSGNSSKGRSSQEAASERKENVEHYSKLAAWSGAWLPLRSLKDEFTAQLAESRKKHFRALDESSFSEEDLPFLSFKIAGDKLLFFDTKLDDETHLIAKRIFSFDKHLELGEKDYFVFKLEKEINIGGRQNYHFGRRSNEGKNADSTDRSMDFSADYLILSPISREELVRNFYLAFFDKEVDVESLQDLSENKKMEFVISFDSYKRFEPAELFARIDKILAE